MERLAVGSERRNPPCTSEPQERPVTRASQIARTIGVMAMTISAVAGASALNCDPSLPLIPGSRRLDLGVATRNNMG
jgi:hypothetical protein